MEPRNCCKIIDQMIAKIPADKIELIKDLEWNKEDAKYKAPEEVIQWQRTMETLQKHIFPKPTWDWEFEVLSIFTTHSIDSLKFIFNNPE
jgi:hypothetical protein